MSRVQATPAAEMAAPAASVPRDDAIELLKGLPADSTYDDIVRALAMARMFDRGQADLAAGRTITHEEVGKRIEQWGS